MNVFITLNGNSNKQMKIFTIWKKEFPIVIIFVMKNTNNSVFVVSSINDLWCFCSRDDIY